MKKALIIISIFALILGFVSVTFADTYTGVNAFNSKAIMTIIILIMVAVLFLTDALPLPITAMLAPITLSFPGIDILTSADAFKEFGNKWVVLFMAAFIIGEVVFKTGFADKVGRATVKAVNASQLKLTILIMITIGFMSAFLSNTGTIAVFIPIVIGICASANIKPGKILMPMAFAASLGGTMTLVGTPPNAIVNSALESAGLEPFGFFEFAKIGAILFIAGVLYHALIGYRLLPDTDPITKSFENKRLEYRTEKMWISVAILVFVILMTATKMIPLVTAFMLGACLAVSTGCITMKEAFDSISWTTIFLFAGMIPLGTAMNTTGAAKLIADIVVSHVGSPIALLAATFIITAIVTNFMSNTATTVLMTPIGIALANGFGVNPEPIVIGIAMAASACFLTPIATPPNTIVLEYGGYKFIDYLKAGWILQVIVAILSITLIPIIWPF